MSFGPSGTEWTSLFVMAIIGIVASAACLVCAIIWLFNHVRLV